MHLIVAYDYCGFLNGDYVIMTSKICLCDRHCVLVRFSWLRGAIQEAAHRREFHKPVRFLVCGTQYNRSDQDPLLQASTTAYGIDSERLLLAELRRSREGLQSTHPGRMRFP